MQQDYEPKMLFIVVKKRINTRYFRREGGNRMGNPVAGTVVDTAVTRPQWYDFFLISPNKETLQIPQAVVHTKDNLVASM
jgi:aubergine-like protein